MTSVEAHQRALDDASPSLTVRVGTDIHTAAPSQAPLVIGREDFDAAHQPWIRIPDGRISRTHLTVEHRDGRWVGVPQGRNGSFVRGELVTSAFEIPDDGLEVSLGSPVGGIKMSFSTLDPAMVYVGAQVAKRRGELDVSQRTLAAEKIMNAGALIQFEKGRSWPRPKTREKLEEVLQWPRGTIDQMRRDRTAATATMVGGENAELVAPVGNTTTIDSGMMAQTVALALASLHTQVDALPDPSSTDFALRVQSMLPVLRQLEALASRAAQEARGTEALYQQLSAVRKLYRDVMLRAARSPHATLGQRVFAARHRAELSVEEAATMVDLTPGDVHAAESDAPLGDSQRVALQRLLAAL